MGREMFRDIVDGNEMDFSAFRFAIFNETYYSIRV